jgi:hypothetical protein
LQNNQFEESKLQLSKAINDTVSVDEKIMSILNGANTEEDADLASLISNAQMLDSQVEVLAAQVVKLELKRQEEERIQSLKYIKQSLDDIKSVTERSEKERDSGRQDKMAALALIQDILNKMQG